MRMSLLQAIESNWRTHTSLHAFSAHEDVTTLNCKTSLPFSLEQRTRSLASAQPLSSFLSPLCSRHMLTCNLRCTISSFLLRQTSFAKSFCYRENHAHIVCVVGIRKLGDTQHRFAIRQFAPPTMIEVTLKCFRDCT